MRNKAPLFKDMNVEPYKVLTSRLSDHFSELIESLKTKISIRSSANIIGYGIDKSKKDLACEMMITILREIRKIKGW